MVIKRLPQVRWLAVTIAIPTLLFLSLRYPPATDFPEHVLAIGVLRGLFLGDPAFTAHYEANFATSPYLAYHVLGAAIAVVVQSAHVANRILLFAIALAFPLTFRRVLIAFEADRRLAWFAILPFFSRALSIGFLPYLFSVPLGLWLLARTVEHTRGVGMSGASLRPVRSFVELSLFATLLFYSHVSSFTIFVPTAALCALALSLSQSAGSSVRQRAARAGRALVWLALPTLAAVRFILVGRLSARSGAGLDDGAPALMGVERSLYALPLWIFDNYRHRYDDGLSIVYWGLSFAAAAYSIVRALRGKHRVSLLKAIPLLVAALVYVATPFRVGAASFLNVRLAPIVVLLALIPLRVPPIKWFTRAVGGMSLAGGLMFYVSSYLCEREEAAGLREVLAAIPPGAKVVSLNFDHSIRSTHVAPYIYEGSFHTAEHGGSASFSFASLPHWSVHYRADAAPPRHRPFWVFSPCEFRNRTDGRYFDAVLVRGELNPFAAEPAGPAFVKRVQRGQFALYLRDDARTFEGPDRSPCRPLRPQEPRDPYAP
jgi:hypothetical protein